MSPPPDPAEACPAEAWPARLVTVGPALCLDLPGGRVPVRLRGINRSGLQHKPSLATAGWAPVEDELRTWRADWNVQAVRVPLALDSLLGNAAYRDDVARVVDAAEAARQYLILEVHGLAPDVQPALPPPEAEAAWQLLAEAYGGRAHVVFDLWNEPHDVAWPAWQACAQTLVDAVRAAGAADTLVLVGGIDWAADLSPLLVAESRLDGRGGPLAYAVHVYPWTTSLWWRRPSFERAFGRVARELPVLVTELGIEPASLGRRLVTRAWLRGLLRYVDELGLSALAWSAGDRPHLVHGTSGSGVRLPDDPPDPSRPSEPFGRLVREWLSARPV